MRKTVSQKREWEKYYIIGLCLLLTSLIVYSFFIQKSDNGLNLHVANRPAIMPLKPVSEDDNFRWKNNSRYTLVVYTSLDCDHCRKLFNFIESRYELFRDSFNLIYRNVPLSDIEPLSKGKVIIAECLRQEGGSEIYFQFIKNLYKEYKIFQDNNDWAYTIAEKFSPKKQELRSCMDSGTMKKKVEDNQQDAYNDGVTTTPTLGIFFDNELVGRYAVDGQRAMQIVEYLSLFSSKADQFWSEELLSEYLKKYEPSPIRRE